MTPATWFKARISNDADGRLAITWRYHEPNVGGGTHWIDQTEEWFGVPFQQWERSIGETIDLTKWQGTAYGMIGGPRKMNRDGVLYCGWLARIANLPPQCVRDGYSAKMDQIISKEVRELEEELNDERFEFSPQTRQRLEKYVAAGRAFLARQDYHPNLSTGG